jgi:hypothetical protein
MPQRALYRIVSKVEIMDRPNRSGGLWHAHSTPSGYDVDDSDFGLMISDDNQVNPRSTDTQDLFRIEQALEHQGQPRRFVAGDETRMVHQEASHLIGTASALTE